MSRYRFTTCALCRESDAKTVIKWSDPFVDLEGIFEVVQCTSCGLTRTLNLPQPDDLNVWYSAHYGGFQDLKADAETPESGETNSISKKRGLLKKLGLSFLVSQLRINYSRYAVSSLPHQGKILEVGCGIGKILLPLKEGGAEVVGIEPSPGLAKTAQASGLDVHCMPFEQFEGEPNIFDHIVFSYTLEHIENPVEALIKALTLLKPDGRIHIFCPNLVSINRYFFGRHWFCWHLPYHKYFFSAESLGKVFNATGYRVAKQESDFRVDEIVESWRIAWHQIVNKKKSGFPTRFHPFLMLFSAIVFLPFKFFGRGNLLHMVATPKEGVNAGEGAG